MKKLFTTLVLASLIVIVRAQPPKPPTPEERLKRTSELIQKEVQPTADQQKVIEAVFKIFFTAADKVRKDNLPPPPPPPDPAVKAAMDKLVKERDEAIKKVLTADQYEKYKETAKKLQPPPPGRPGGNNGTPPPPQQ